MKIPKTPSGLNTAGKKFWKKVLSEFELSETHDLERLSMAARTLDDLAEAEKQVKKDGMFTVNRYGGTVEHPAVKTVRDTRMLFIKIVRELGLDLAIPEDSRPPRRY
jgi:P27 family predicted phage terminase small subunit